MTKVPWIASKDIDFDKVASILDVSIKSNQMSNYGPVVVKLEHYFRTMLKIAADRCVIAVANGAVGLHTMASVINMMHNRKLTYATQAFTFPCSIQGPLDNSIIVDVDDDLGLDLEKVDEHVDGIIVTNLFGHVTDIQKYEQWAKDNNKILLFDNATVSSTSYKGTNACNFGDGCIISLHHTKPIGFGEGGLIIAKKIYEPYIRQCINFGFKVTEGVISCNRYGNNHKMSELSAAFILSYLQPRFNDITSHYRKLYAYFINKIKDVKTIKLFPNYSDDIPFISCIPVFVNKKVTNNTIYDLELSNITARKYYTPLEPLVKSMHYFEHIICLPLNMHVDEDTIDRYVVILTDMK